METPKVQNQQEVGVLETLMVATQIFFIFNPTWGNDPNSRASFSDGLVQPPTIVVVWRCFKLIF